MPDISRNQHLDHLDGIRGLAAMFVVAHHFWFTTVGFNAQPGLTGWLTNWLLYGHMAVNVFIVLSGFCLTLPLATPPHEVNAKTFFLRRARRILPPYFIVLAFSIGLDFVWETWVETSTEAPETWMTYAVNVLMLQDLMPRHNVINVPFWSVALEAKIYLLFPLLVLLKVKRGVLTMLLVAGMIGYGLTAFIGVVKPQATLHTSSVWFVALFGLGMAAAFATSYRNALALSRIAMGLGGCLGAALLMRYPITANGLFELYEPKLVYIDTAIGILFAGFLLWMVVANTTARGIATRLLSRRPLVFVGTFAYTLYLIHWPLMEPVSYVWKALFGHLDPLAHAVSVTIVGTAFSVLFSYFAFKIVERPFLRRRKPAAAPRMTKPEPAV